LAIDVNEHILDSLLVKKLLNLRLIEAISAKYKQSYGLAPTYQ